MSAYSCFFIFSLDFLLLFYGKGSSEILLPAFTAFAMLFWLLFAASNLIYYLVYNSPKESAIKTATIVKSILQALMGLSFIAMWTLKSRAEEQNAIEEEEEVIMSARQSMRYRPNIDSSPEAPSIAATL